MEHISPRQLSMTFVYIFIALATDNYKGVVDLVDTIWTINGNGDTEDEKFALIKSFIQINVTRWDKYNNMYDQIVEGKEGVGAFKRYFMRIPRGVISLKQFLWILGYIVYSVFTPLLIEFDPAADFLIDLCGLGFFLFTGSSVIGLGAFMGDMFETIKVVKGKTVKQSLQLLESQIIFDSRRYGFLKNKVNLKRKENGI
jgi:hypothetical protein